MHILWLKSDYIDPPDSGGKIRTYNLLRQLRNRCQVTYLSPKYQAGTNGNVKDLPWASQVITFPRPEEPKEGFGFYSRIFARMLSTRPFIVQKYCAREIRQYQRLLCAASEHFAEKDGPIVIVCDFLEMTGNVLWSLPCPKLLFQHNVESVIWRRYSENERNRLKKAYFWFEYQRLKRYERIACNRFDLVLTVSPKDKEVLEQELGVRTPVEVIQTGVDTEFFAPRQDIESTPGKLLFLGSLDWMPNIDAIKWFVDEVYPLIKIQYPQVTLDIVGRRPAASMCSLAEDDRSIRILGNVADVRPYIAAADIFIVPLRIGSGTRLKIYEAMAMQRPVVSTAIGAEGLPVEHGRHLLLADSPRDFAEATISLLMDSANKRALAAAGYEFVTSNYSWKTVSEKLYDACLQVCQKKHN